MWWYIMVTFLYLPNPQALAVAFKVDGLNQTQSPLKTTIQHEEWTKHEAKQGTASDVETVSSNATTHTSTTTKNGDITDITRITKLEYLTERNHNIDTSATLQKDETAKANTKHTAPLLTRVEKESVTRDIDVITRARDILQMKVNSSNETITKDNSIKVSQILRTREIDNSKIVKFLVDIYDSSVRILNNLHDQIDDSDLNQWIDKAIASFKNEFKLHVGKNGTTHNLLDKVLNVLEVTKFIKEFADNFAKHVISKKKAIDDSFYKLLKEKNEYICKEFGVCRNANTFRNFLTGFIEIIQKASKDKKYSAMQAYLQSIGKSKPLIPSFTQSLVGDQFWKNFGSATKSPNSWFNNIKVSELDNLIPANADNVALWRKLTTDIKSFADGNIQDSQPIFNKLANHMQAHGIEIGNLQIVNVPTMWFD